jgi:DNA-binding transcriptional LysR family regulator
MDQLLGLRVFCRVVERESFTAVGREFGLSQSTVSRLVAEIEGRVGARLLARTTRRVQPTEQGRALYERVSRAVAELLEAEREVAAGEGVLAGRLRVAAPGVFGKHFVVPAVTAFLAQNPRVEAEVLLGDRPVDLIEAGVDLAIRIGASSPGNYLQRPLGELEQALVAAPAYLAARGRPRTLPELDGHAALFHADTRATLQELLHRGILPALPSFEVRLLSDDIEAVRAGARAGLGIAPLSAWMVAEDLASGRLVRLFPELRVPPARVVAVSPPGRPPARVAAFLACLSTHITGEIARLAALLALDP